METKKQIRKDYKKRREAMTEAEVLLASERICEVIASDECYKNTENIGFYYPLGKEVRLIELVKQAWQTGKKTWFPRVNGETMDFYEITDLSQLAEGCFHVMEPLASCGSAGVPELILVPGVVFDRMGNRAGYGMGFYDRYLLAHPDCIRMGIACERQITQQIPAEEQDVRMQYLATELGIKRIGG